MNGLSFMLETPYVVNFRKPYSTITLLSFPFPPYTAIRGLIASAMGMGDLSANRDTYNSYLNDLLISLKPLTPPDRFLDMVLMKKLKSNLKAGSKKPNENTVVDKLKKNDWDLSKLDGKEIEIYRGLEYPRSTSAPFVKEYVIPIKCRVYLKCQEQKGFSTEDIADALENPARPLYVGASDDFVIISELSSKDFKPDKSRFIDSVVKVDNEIYPLNKKLIVGRVPYKFVEYGTKKKRDYFREDWVIASPKAGERVELNKEIDCFMADNEFISF